MRFILTQIWFCTTHQSLLTKSPFLNGVPEVASSEISRNFTKIWEIIFVNLFLFLEADHFCHNLFLKRCSKACICGNKPTKQKIWRAIFACCSYYLMQNSFFTTSHTRCLISWPSVLAQNTDFTTSFNNEESLSDSFHLAHFFDPK